MADCVTGCGQETGEQLCRGCRRDLATKLAAIAYSRRDDGRRGPGLADDLEATIVGRAQRDKAGRTGGRGTGPSSPPFNPRATAANRALTATVTTWAREFHAANRHLHPRWHTVPDAAEWMSRYPYLLATHPHADTMHREITAVVARVKAIVDVRPMVYLGVCSAPARHGEECGQDLYAPSERAVVVCPACGTQHEAAERRRVLAASVDDQLGTAVDCSRIVPWLTGQALPAVTVRQWARRGQLGQRDPHPDDPRKTPRYRIGDVVTLASARAATTADTPSSPGRSTPAPPAA